jgi:uncharacterized membrane protein YfcA
MDFSLIAAGVTVGLLVGLTGMGAGSLMTPILISVFGIPATTAVGTDLLYSAVTKTFGAARHNQLSNVNRELAMWFGYGSVPAALAGTFALYNVFGDNVSTWLPNVIGYMLILVGIAVAIRTFITIRGLYDASKLPTDGPLNRNHKILAVTIGLVFGFLLGLTSVGSGVFFGMAMVTLFPLSTRRVVGTDIFHGAMVTIAASVGTILWGSPNYGAVGWLLIGSIPGILIGSHFTARMNQKLLRSSLATVLAASGLKLLGAW